MKPDTTPAIIENPPFPKEYASRFLELSHGKGSYLYDTSGNRYLDFGAGIAVNALGHGRKDLAKIASKQMQKVIHVSNLYTTEPAVKLAERLVRLGDFAAVHFGNSGSEANETAIKFARMYGKRAAKEGAKPREKLLCFQNAFHGRTMGALSVTPTEKYQEPFGPLVPGVEVAALNKIESLDPLASGEYCAVIIEPVQGEGGLTKVTHEFSAALNDACKKHDVILIADEVQTGIGRCGFDLASKAVGLSPDIVTLAKPLAGGLPLSATLIPGKINDLIGTGEHGTTFGGGPVTTSVAGYVVDTVLDPAFLRNVQDISEYLAKGLKRLIAEIEAFEEIRGLGLLTGVTIAENAAHLLPNLLVAAQEQGLLLLRSGTNVIRIAPPLIIAQAEIDEGVAIIENIAKTVLSSEA
jgi:predicted acetylornithine/succinylornithine family transaminase